MNGLSMLHMKELFCRMFLDRSYVVLVRLCATPREKLAVRRTRTDGYCGGGDDDGDGDIDSYGDEDGGDGE